MDKEEQKREEEKKPKMREIIIKTDGNKILLEKTEVAGKIELSAILQIILNRLNAEK